MIAKFKLANLLFAAVTFVSLASCTQVAPDIRRDPAAEQGHASAQNNLGIMSEKGQGAPPDDARVMGSYRAAEQANAIAKYNLGLMYDTGAGVPQDYAEAARWYRSAAEQGHAKAKVNLGIMMYSGDGCAADKPGAVALWREAQEEGVPQADICLRNAEAGLDDRLKK